MSETTDAPVSSEADAADTSAASDEAPKKGKAGEPENFARAHRGLLTQATDQAERPGFRNPANKRTKAQKKKKGKKRR